MGTTKALFQSSGMIPWFSNAWNSIVRQGAISVANSLRNLVGILPGPLALWGFKLDSSLLIPLVVIYILSMSGYVGPETFGMLEMFSCVKTEANWLFSAFAALSESLVIELHQLRVLEFLCDLYGNFLYKTKISCCLYEGRLNLTHNYGKQCDIRVVLVSYM